MKALFIFIPLLFLCLHSLAKPDADSAAIELKLSEDSAERCIAINHIKSLEAVDRHHILVYTRSREVFVNVLPQPCLSLSRHTPLLYRTSQHQLCNVDIVTVLDTIGGGYMPGGSCGLGKFYPIDEAQEKALKMRPR